jgi:pSer/pThr/pTyr-binding forkhead associated (FHA) protein
MKASLQVIHSADRDVQGQVFPMDAEEVSLGREDGNTVVVSSDQASRRHARIVATPAGHLLQDLDSTNGTFVNSKQVKEQKLVHGDVIRIASTVLKYLVG